jgi:DNA-binding SARP family transcriptional activator
VEYRILGPVEVRAAGVVTYVGGPRERRILVALLLNPDRVVSTHRLYEVLWGERPPLTAATQIRNAVSALRRHLAAANGGRSPVERADAGFVIRVGDDELDAVHFDRQARAGRALADQGRLPAAVAALRAATQMWRGPALGGLGAPVLDSEATALEERRRACLEQRIELDLALGHHAELIGELSRLVIEYPLWEHLAEQQIIALYRSGRRQDALDAFAAARDRLAEHAGLDPRPQLVRLQKAVLEDDASLSYVDSGRRGSRSSTPPATGLSVPADLPSDIATFTGRREQTERLDAVLASAQDGPTTTVVISSIAGMAGIGKTSLAIHWSHQVRGVFPDGQLYLNLRGYDPGMSIVEPADALHELLTALGVPASRIPAGLTARSALWRSVLSDKRMLLVLDNARDSEHVRPLLPGAAGSFVLVTSRSSLSGLIMAHGAHSLVLDALSEAEATDMLVRRLGAERVAAEPEAVSHLISLTAGLPLALAIVAARAAISPTLSLRTIADQLRDAGTRLDALNADETSTDIRAVFSWSYRTLGPAAQQLFRRLGAHPGPDVSTAAVASISGLPMAQVRPLLAELTRAHLLTEHTSGRYAFHDLLRAYAADLAHASDSVDERSDAIRRTLDHYLHTAQTADRLLDPTRDALTTTPPTDGVTPEEPSGPAQALAWFTTERRVLVRLVEQASSEAFHVHCVHMAWSLTTFFDRQGHWQDEIAAQGNALESAESLADPSSVIRSRRMLALAYARLLAYDEARGHYAEALRLCRDLGRRADEAHVLRGLAYVFELEGRYAEALASAEEVLEIYRATGHRAGEGYALNMVGWFRALLGEHEQALARCQEALEILVEADEAFGQAAALDSLGYAYHHMGDHRHALASYDRALDIYRRLGDLRFEADVLNHIGDAHEAACDVEAARDAWERALKILDDLGHPDADEIRAKLESTLVP